MVETFLIIGLGNPGREYRETRHNLGFMLVDRLAVKLNARFTRLQSKALVASALYQERKVILAKPQTFMNLSGQAAQGLVHFYKVPFNQLLVAYDELDLPPGTLRIRPDGGSAGHNGMASVLERFGTNEFPRLRMGIGHPPGRMSGPDFVLQEFSNAEMSLFSETLDRGVDAVLCFITDGLEAAMTKYNGSVVEK